MRRGDDAKGGEGAASVETPPGESSASARAAAPTAASADVDSHADTVAGDSGAGTDPGSVPASGRATDEMTDSLVGAVLQERYEITRKVGQGGMGAVYEARHKLIGKRVAVKILLDKYAQKESIVARLEQEARLASSIGHENIIDITDFGTIDDGRTFVVMEYLEGESLGALLAREGRLKPERALPIARQIASALGAAHKKNVIHRDVKPENIFLQRRDDRDFVKVVDFGISKFVRPEEETDARLTQTGMVLGTPLYMSPEQARGDEELDHRIDVYAVGVILYEMITGEVPFTGGNYLNIVSQVLSEEPKAPTDLVPDLSEDVELVILKALEKDRDQRYQSMAELDEDLATLESAQEGLSTTAARLSAGRVRRKRRRERLKKQLAWTGGVAVVAAAVVLAVTSLTGSHEKTAGAQAAVAADAAVPSRADAAPAKPPWEVATVHIDSKPQGATLYQGSRLLGPTPYDLKVDKSHKEFQIEARLEGYGNGTAPINPHLDDGRHVMIELEAKKPEEATEKNGQNDRGAHRHGRGRHGNRRNGKTRKGDRKHKGDKVDDSLGGELGGFR